MARLDRLARKEVAQIGAAIGREFSHALFICCCERRRSPELVVGPLARLVLTSPLCS